MEGESLTNSTEKAAKTDKPDKKTKTPSADQEKKNVHKGHRLRVFEKFDKYGPDSFHDHELLEMLLFHAIPQANTNPIAHDLLNRFGKFHDVFDAPAEQLCEIDGINIKSARYIKELCALIARYEKSRSQADNNSARLLNRRLIAEYFIPEFTGKTEESLLVAFLDSMGRVIKCEELGRGSNTQVIIDPPTIVRHAVIYNAVGVLLAHNHPHGQPFPSANDKKITANIGGLLSEIGIKLVAHCIVAGATASFVDHENEKYTLGEQ